MDLFVRDDFQPRRLGIVLLRMLLARTREVIFTSSAGPATQALLRYYGVIPIPQFQRQWTLPAEQAAGPRVVQLELVEDEEPRETVPASED